MEAFDLNLDENSKTKNSDVSEEYLRPVSCPGNQYISIIESSQSSKTVSINSDVSEEYLRPVSCPGNQYISIIESSQSSEKLASNSSENTPTLNNDAENIHGDHHYLEKCDGGNKYPTVLETNSYITVLETAVDHNNERCNQIKPSLTSHVVSNDGLPLGRKESVHWCRKYQRCMASLSAGCVAVIMIISLVACLIPMTGDISGQISEAAPTSLPRGPFLYTSIINASYQVHQKHDKIVLVYDPRNTIHLFDNIIWLLTRAAIVMYQPDTLEVINRIKPLQKPKQSYKAMTHDTNGHILLIHHRALYDITPVHGSWANARRCTNKRILSGSFHNVNRYNSTIYVSSSQPAWQVYVLSHRGGEFTVKNTFQLRGSRSFGTYFRDMLGEIFVTDTRVYVKEKQEELYVFDHIGDEVRKLLDFTTRCSLCGVDNAGNILLTDIQKQVLRVYAAETMTWLEAVNLGGQFEDGLRGVIFDDFGTRMWALAHNYGAQDHHVDLVHLTRVRN